MIWPVAGRGRPRQRHVPDILSKAAEDVLVDATWQNIRWRTGTKGKLEDMMTQRLLPKKVPKIGFLAESKSIINRLLKG